MEPSVSNPRAKQGQDARLLTVEEARERILAGVSVVRGTESVPVRDALGRVLAADVHSPIDVPGHTNSGVDGYALAATTLPADGARDCAIAGTSWAGRPYSGTVGDGQCARIMTGAALPAGTDTVIMQEHVELHDGRVRIGAGHKHGQNVRMAGEDLARGQVALMAGKRLMPQEIGLLASIGLSEVGVTRRPRVAFFSTGDELRSVGEPLGLGEIYDSNRYTLHGMLTRTGVELVDMGVVRDRREDVRAAFTEAANLADAIITSGGVSVGEADYVKETLDAIGRVGFWKIAMKPGRPLAFGHVGDTAFFGLPGNPVSVMVCYYQFVQPALRRMMGEAGDTTPLTFRARCTSRFRKQPGRAEYQRAVAERDANGEYIVHSTGDQGSGILSSMAQGNCFVVIGRDQGDVEPGMIVDIQPFFGMI
jgi:molybdopterin molybdotransferase